MKKIAVLASGAGSNFRNIVNHFSAKNDIQVALLVSNKPGCGAVKIAKEKGVNTFFIQETADYLRLQSSLLQLEINLVVLAGYLKLIPAEFISNAPPIINVHPSLLPKYGGKGMYGMNVHKAVFANKEKETGISIHRVNEHFDEGEIIVQYQTDISDCVSPAEIEKKIRNLEEAFFVPTIEKILRNEI